MISPFAQKVYKLLKTVPKGKVTTYKELAKALDTNAFQAIGQIMRTNPNAPTVPCHRVVSATGMIGGFMGESSGPKVLEKIHLLKKEGVIVHGNKVVDFERKLWKFRTNPGQPPKAPMKGNVIGPSFTKK